MSYQFENWKINRNIKIVYLFKIEKMEDIYLSVRFTYPDAVWNGAIPIRAKYQGVNVALTKEDIKHWVMLCYEELNPARHRLWLTSQNEFWRDNNSEDTKLVFDALNGTEAITRWLCRKCGPVPGVNPQAAARIRTLKEKGYHIATLKKDCASCGKKQYFDLLIRLPRNAADNQRRSTITQALKAKVLATLPHVDCAFEVPLDERACVIDHKFPSSRWVNGESPNQTDMTPEQICNKFQILSNQTNLQKERYCQRCVIDGVRGDFFGISWYYQGGKRWAGTSKADENGCAGCPWYDMAKWKKEFNKHLAGLSMND